MKYHEMTKNYIFREFECGLSVEEAAELCLKSVRTIKQWDKGKAIPPECRRLMRMNKGRELSICDDWENFVMRHDRLELPTGQRVTAQQVLIRGLRPFQRKVQCDGFARIRKGITANQLQPNNQLIPIKFANRSKHRY